MKQIYRKLDVLRKSCTLVSPNLHSIIKRVLRTLWRSIRKILSDCRGECDLKTNETECSSLFAPNSCVHRATCYNKCGRIGKKWLFFFTFIEECCVVIEKNIDEKLANRINYQIWDKRCLKGKFLRGSESPNQVRHLLSDRSKKNTFWRVNHLQSPL